MFLFFIKVISASVCNPTFICTLVHEINWLLAIRLLPLFILIRLWCLPLHILNLVTFKQLIVHNTK
jgi:hypothetical protein